MYCLGSVRAGGGSAGVGEVGHATLLGQRWLGLAMSAATTLSTGQGTLLHHRPPRTAGLVYGDHIARRDLLLGQ